MKPVPFDYVPAGTVREAVGALADTSRPAAVLAGGQSLLIELHFRRARPHRVVDINRIAALGHLRVDGQTLRVGALVRHEAFESPTVAPGPLGRLLALVAPHIAHPPIRALGTMAGSLAWAHPAAEWCATAVALDAGLEMQSTEGVRYVSAHDFFHGPHRTARQPHELITSVHLPLLDATTGVGFVEHRRTHASFAQSAVVAALTVRDGVVAQARLGLANAADRPVRAHAAEETLVGLDVRRPGRAHHSPDRVVERAGQAAAEQDAAPRAQPYADVDYQRHVIAVLVRRALTQALADLVSPADERLAEDPGRGSGEPGGGEPGSGEPRSGQPRSGEPRSGEPGSGEATGPYDQRGGDG